MARLDTPDGGWLELTPVGYQFDDDDDEDPYDRNWLQVAFAADLGLHLRVKRRTEPAFLTWELASFVGACRAPRPSELPVRVLDGLEPNLAIDLLDFRDGEWTLSVDVALSFAPYLREPFDDPFNARLVIGEASLKAFIDELERELDAFPVR
jgi:hypothetical protein